MTNEPQELNWPNNIDAERAVLGGMMLDGSTVGEAIQVLKPSDFFLNAHQILFGTMLDLASAGKPLDLTLMSDILRRENKLDAVGGYVYMAGLVEYVLYSGATVQNAEMVAEKAALRRTMIAAQQVLRAASTEVAPAAQIVANGHELLFNCTQKTHKQTSESLEECVPRALSNLIEQVEMRGKGPSGEISWFLDDLDNATGGIRTRELSVLAARPGVGKTILAMEVVRRNAENGINAHVFSLEMPTEQLILRYFAVGAGVSYTGIQKKMLLPSDLRKISEYGSKLMQLGVSIDESSRLTASEIYMRTRMAKARNPKLKLVVIDSLKLMNHGADTRGGPNLAQRIGDSMVKLMEMAKDPALDVAVLLIHHVARANPKTGGRPTLASLRDSGEIEQWCHNVYFLHPSGEPNNGAVPTEFIAAKQRYRGEGEGRITMDGTHQTFRSAEWFE